MAWDKDIPLSTASLATSQGTISGNFIAIEGVLGSQTLTDGITLAQGDILYADDAATIKKLAKATTNQRVLTNNGTDNSPVWGQVSATTGISGILPIANGGTNTNATTFCDLTANVTGTLPVGNGGTGATAASNAANGVAVLGADGYLANSLVDTTALKTTTSEVSSTSDGWTTLSPTGTAYAFYPQIKSSSAGATAIGFSILNNASITLGTSYVNRISIEGEGGVTTYAQFTYVTASGLDYWIFLLIDKSTNDIFASAAKDHPSYGIGNPEKIPHPFPSYNSATQEIILLDKKSCNLLEQESKNTGKSILTLIDKDYKVDMTSILTYESLHSGSFIDKAPIMIKTIPDYITVRKLKKLTSAEKKTKETKNQKARQLIKMKKQEKEQNKISAKSKLKVLGLTIEEVEAIS